MSLIEPGSHPMDTSDRASQSKRKVKPDDSLGLFIDGHFEGIDEVLAHLTSDERQWTKALLYWYGLNSLLVDDNKAVLNDLSPVQQTSFRLLREWWTAQYQWPEMSLAYILQIVDKSDEIPIDSEDEQKYMDEVIESLRLVRWPTDDIKLTDHGKSTMYNTTMYQLWVYELDSYDHDVQKDNIRQLRRDAILAAWTQEMTFLSFSEAVIANTSLVSEDVVRRYLPKHGQKSKTSFLQSSLPLRRGPHIKPCPWLTTGWTGVQEDMPYYLWDRESSQTVATADLPGFVEYTCISHTWGRYTIPPPPAPAEKVSVPGVPWTMPRNQNFEILELGSRLKGVRCNTRYVWIDLFCIPQDGSALMQVEIGRQALIFQNAAYVVAWLNNVESFDSLKWALIIMSYSLLSLPNGCADWDVFNWAMDGALEKMGTKPSGLLRKREERFNKMQIESNPWFTSLWTLQELCLRPDMWLCSRDWEMLSITREEHMPIIGIVAIWNCFQHYRRNIGPNKTDRPDPFKLGDPSDESEQIGVAFAEIDHWITATAIDRLAYITRADILAIGDRRVCLSRRAEAIMSCLGTTNWYTETPYEDHESDLVMNKYPLPFIQEVQSSGAMNFFGDLMKKDWAVYSPTGIDYEIALDKANRPDKSRPAEFKHTWAQPRGTLLPFSMYGSAIMPATSFFSDSFDAHPSISTWTIQTSGRVLISSACILASSNPSLGPFQRSSVTLIAIPHSPDPGADLQEWVASRPFECHAVVVSTRTYWSRKKGVMRVFIRTFNGIVLGTLEGQGVFVRLGHFTANVKFGDVPEARSVGWVVA